MERLILLVLGVAALAAPAQPAWHHAASPYRARFEVTAPPTGPEAGVALNVPLCGLGFADGSDVRVFDAGDTPLATLAVGEGLQNGALVLAQARPETKRLFAYFGSRSKAASNRAAFRPSLLVDIRTFPGGGYGSWAEVEKMIAASTRIACLPVEQINLSYNPADSRDAFIMVFDGYLRVAKPGPQTFMLVSDDAGYLFIGGKLVISRDGERGVQDSLRGEFRATVELSAGLHPIRCVVVDKGRDQMAVVARYINERSKSTLERDDFLQAGKARLEGVEARDRNLPCPAFRHAQQSYIGYQGIQYTEVELATLNGELAEWQFGDGARHAGASLRRVFAGLASVPVRVRQGKVEAEGLVTFPENPPPVRDVGNAAHFTHYVTLIQQENLGRLAIPTLKAYRTLLGYREMNPDLFPVCNALLNKPDLDPGLRAEVLLDLARATVAAKPDAALWAYRELMNAMPPPPARGRTAREYFEYALLARDDAALAEKLARELERDPEVREEERQAVRLLMALQRGAAADAKALLQRMADAAAGRSPRAAAAIRRNACEKRFDDLLRSGFPLDARRQLWVWETLTPDDWGNGRLAVARARFWRVAALPQAGLKELQFALALDPLLPNLPEVEYLQAELLAETGQDKQARDLFQRVADKYPNHPLAARARLRLQR